MHRLGLSPIQPFYAAHYSTAHLAQLDQMIVRDMDSAHNIWGGPDSSLAFRNVLVGSAERRSDTWQAWLGSNVIECQDRPAFYILRQSFEQNDSVVDRWAILAALSVEDSDIIIHEDVVEEGVERARQATEACEGDLAPIFVGYDESLSNKIRNFFKEAVVGKKPLLQYHEPDGTRFEHSVWELADTRQIQMAQDLFRGEKLYLLDGHHRLAAARSNLRQGLGDGKILACVCSLSKEDTLILPIHRAIHYGPWMLGDRLIEDWVKAGCHVEEVAPVHPKLIEQQIASLLKDNMSCLMLHAHANKLLQLKFPRNQEAIAVELQDMAVAHLEFYLEEKFSKASVIPVTDAKLALEQLALEQAQVAFFLPPLTAHQVKRVAKAGLRLPRKSTRFVPKPALGLIMRPWR